jgi:hypothetical protein
MERSERALMLITRTEQRKDIDDHSRITLLEGDIDRADKKLDRLFTKFDRLTQSVVALVIAIIAAAVSVAFH